MNEKLTHIGRYEIIERVGRGGMGVLYRGRDTVLDREVAIKVMSGDFSSEEGARARFFREAKAAARLQHRNVVTVFEFAEHDETPFIVMEFLRGRSLSVRMKESPDLTLAEKLDVIIQLCSGLEFAHREGVVHRDVKPGNVWICEDGSVKLLDFGIAKSASSTITSFGAVIGSPSYMSPEQISGQELDGRSDVFSAGVVLYELLGARKPFDAETPTAVMMQITGEPPRPLHELVPTLPTALLATVSRALEKDPEARYAAASELAADLRLVLLNLEDGKDLDATELIDDTLATDRMSDAATERTPAGNTTILTPALAPATTPGRRRTAAVVAAVALAVVILAGVVATTGIGRAGGSPPANSKNLGTLPPITPSPPPVVPSVRVTSVPEGAALSIDGKDSGRVTPFDVSAEDQGRAMRLSKRGFQAADVLITEEVRQRGGMTVTLKPAAGRVLLSGPYPFEVSEGGRVLSKAAATHLLTLAGPHTLRATARDVLLNRTINVDAREGVTLPWRAPALGQIVIRTSHALDTCKAWLDDLSLGPLPILEAQRVVEGKHMVTVKCPSGQDQQVPVVVVAGESREARIR